MFSKTCEYAIRAIIYIAQGSKHGRRVAIKEIARSIDAPEHFIAKILQNLVRTGLVQSSKGPTGGFYLDTPSLKNSLADIVKAVDGDKLFTGCGMGLDYCDETKPCPIHNDFKKLRTQVWKMLNGAKIGALHDKLEDNVAFLKRT